MFKESGGSQLSTLLELTDEVSIWIQQVASLQTRECQLHHQSIKEVLVQWKDTSPEDAIWEPTSILQQFPHLQP